MQGQTQRSDDEQSFRFFAVAIAVATLILFGERHYLFFVRDGWVPMPVALPMALAVGVACIPSNVRLFLAFWASYAYYLLLGFPENNTNQTLLFASGVTIVASAVRCLRRSGRVEAAELYRVFEPVVRSLLVVLYFWAAWHKLNWDYLDPAVSCAPQLAMGFFELFGMEVELPGFVRSFMVIGSLLTEAGLALGLIFRRTQVPTAFVGIAFHFMLGASGFYGFSTTMMVALTLFLAPAAGRLFSGYERKPFAALPKAAVLNRILLFGYLGFLGAAKFGLGLDPGWLGRWLWFLLPAVLGLLWFLNRSQEAPPVPSATPLSQAVLRPSLLWVVPIVFFANGASPFLGFKTEYSYAMYSNLRTEGGTSNHVLWSRPLALAGYQTDLVEVLEGSDAALLERFGGRPITRYELQQALSTMADAGERGVSLRVRSEGSLYSFAAAEQEADWARKGSWLERKLLNFRWIVPSATDDCAH